MRLFDKEQKTLSNEMIAAQINDAAIDEITGLFQKIIDEQKNYSLNNNKSFFIKKPFKNIIAKLDAVIKERFGVPVKHVDGAGFGYAVMANPPVNFNVLNNNIPDIYEAVSQELRMTPGEDDTRDRSTLVDDTDSYRDDYFRIMSQWKKSMDSLENKLASESVVIDLEKAKIHNLPKDYKIFIMADFKYLIDKANLTAREMTAVMMHEIGHLFTHLEYSYRTVNNTSVLLDSMQEYIVKKGMNPKKAIVLTYNDLGGEENLNDASTVTAIIKLMDKFRIKSSDMTDSNHAATDSEMLADQFSGRFGLSNDLASGLDKMVKEMRKPLNMLIYFITLISYITFITLVMIAWIGSIAVGLGMVLSIIATVFIADTFITKGGTNSALVYDVDKQRFQRMKNEMVRQLRTMNFDKKTTKELLISIDNVSKLIEITPDSNPNMLNKLYRLVFSGTSKHYLNLKEMDELIENLQENNLYVDSNKLKGLI